MSLPIHPETKVGALLEAHPDIEERLIEWVPAFSKLKNPVLRKTVARVATLEQAAKIGGIGVRELVRRLREATGQEAGATTETEAPVEEGPPAWLQEERVRFRVDAEAVLKSGGHPMGKVRECVAQLAPGEIVCLESSFHPAPLIDAMRRSGLGVYSTAAGLGRHLTYVLSRPGAMPPPASCGSH